MRHIEIAGKSYPVHFSVNALIEFDELTGLDVTAGVMMEDLRKLKIQRALAYVGLKHGAMEEGKPFELSIAGVGAMMDLQGLMTEQIMTAFNKDMPEVDDKGAPSEDTKKKPDGQT